MQQQPPAPAPRRGPRPALSEEQVSELKDLRFKHHRSYRELATLYGVSTKTIHYYLHNQNKRGRPTPIPLPTPHP